MVPFDPLGYFLRTTPTFRGKWRLLRLWERGCHATHGSRITTLPDGSRVAVDMGVPYERRVWLQAEEWADLCYLRRKLQRGDFFVDVGANIGIWTCVAASAVGPSGNVLSFEPNPQTYAKLVRNLELNGPRCHVKAIEAAVSADDGLASLQCMVAHNVSALVNTSSDRGTICVRTVSLDAELPRLFPNRRPTGIKLDIEGHEASALIGADRLLESCSPWLIVEFNTTFLPSESLGAWSVYSFLTDRGYLPFIYDALGRETRIDASFSCRGYVNLLFQKS